MTPVDILIMPGHTDTGETGSRCHCMLTQELRMYHTQHAYEHDDGTALPARRCDRAVTTTMVHVSSCVDGSPHLTISALIQLLGGS